MSSNNNRQFQPQNGSSNGNHSYQNQSGPSHGNHSYQPQNGPSNGNQSFPNPSGPSNGNQFYQLQPNPSNGNHSHQPQPNPPNNNPSFQTPPMITSNGHYYYYYPTQPASQPASQPPSGSSTMPHPFEIPAGLRDLWNKQRKNPKPEVDLGRLVYNDPPPYGGLIRDDKPVEEVTGERGVEEDQDVVSSQSDAQSSAENGSSEN